MSRSDKFVAAAWMTFFVVGWADSICWPSVGWQVGLTILVVGIVFVLVLVSLAAREEAKARGWRHAFGGLLLSRRSDNLLLAAWATIFVVGLTGAVCWYSVGWQVGLAILVVGIVFVLVLVSLAAREEAKAWGWRHPFRF